jgi:hypothetical protein
MKIRRHTSRTVTILAANDFKCFYCGRKAEHADHIIPKARGGADEMFNLIAACSGCNKTKGVRSLPPDKQDAALAHAGAVAEWIQETGFVGITDQYVLHFKVPEDFLADVDALRRNERDIPNRSEMIRRIVSRAHTEKWLVHD